MKSAYWAGGFTDQPFIRLGVRGQKESKKVIKAVLAHEFGHHAHAKRGLPEGRGLAIGYLQAGKIEKEREAWKIADPFLQDSRQMQEWVKTFALGTYLGRVKIRKVKEII